MFVFTGSNHFLKEWNKYYWTKWSAMCLIYLNVSGSHSINLPPKKCVDRFGSYNVNIHFFHGSLNTHWKMCLYLLVCASICRFVVSSHRSLIFFLAMFSDFSLIYFLHWSKTSLGRSRQLYHFWLFSLVSLNYNFCMVW